jgi:hypothetical protein
LAFAYHRRGGLRVIYGVAVVAGCFEIVGVHLLVAALSPVAAWVLTAFEFYGRGLGDRPAAFGGPTAYRSR